MASTGIDVKSRQLTFWRNFEELERIRHDEQWLEIAHALPCQGWGRGFKSHRPLQFSPSNKHAAPCGTFRRSPAAWDPYPPSLADVERVPVLQVKMQMGAVDVVGFRAKHCGEHLAGALMHAPEELGRRK